MEDLDNIKETESKKVLSKDPLRRALFDRRSGEDKRKRYSLDYFTDGGEERRKSGERRSAWVRVYKWCSIFLGKKAS